MNTETTPLGQQQPTSCGIYFDVQNLPFPDTQEQKDQIFDIVLNAITAIDPEITSLLDSRFTPEANEEKKIEQGFTLRFEIDQKPLTADESMALLDQAVPAIRSAMHAAFGFTEGWAILEMTGKNMMGVTPPAPSSADGWTGDYDADGSESECMG